MRYFNRTISLLLAGVLATAAMPVFAKQLTFGLSVPSMAYPYDVAAVNGFKEAAKKAGVDVTLVNSRGSVEAQANSIQDLLAQNVNAIALMPLDSVVAEGWVRQVNAAGIPIVAGGTQVGNPSTRKLRNVYPGLTALVTTDDTRAGEIAGEMAAKLLPKNQTSKIAVVEGAPGFAIVQQRLDGFREALNKAGVKYDIVATQPTDWTPEQGASVCQNILTAHPGVNLIFSEADPMAIGCARAIASAGSKVKLIATAGGSKPGDAAIRNGEFYGSVCTRPALIGKLMFQALYNAVEKKNTAKRQFITYKLVPITKQTLSTCPAKW